MRRRTSTVSVYVIHYAYVCVWGHLNFKIHSSVLMFNLPIRSTIIADIFEIRTYTKCWHKNNQKKEKKNEQNFVDLMFHIRLFHISNSQCMPLSCTQSAEKNFEPLLSLTEHETKNEWRHTKSKRSLLRRKKRKRVVDSMDAKKILPKKEQEPKVNFKVRRLERDLVFESKFQKLWK